VLRVSILCVPALARPAERVLAFYNQRGTTEQWIKEGKGAVKWTRLSRRSFATNATAEPWSLTSLREKLIKIGPKVVSHGRYVTFQVAEVAWYLGRYSTKFSCLSPGGGCHPNQHEAPQDQILRARKAKARLDEGEAAGSSAREPGNP